MLALHASIDARRRLVRGARLAHDPEGFVVPALRTFDTRPRQGLRDLIEDERVRGLLFPRTCDPRDGRVFPGKRTLVAARIAMHLPLRRIEKRTALRTEHGDGHAKDACDKKVARSELRVIVILQCALDKSLDRALLGLGTSARRMGGRFPRLGLFVVVRFPVVRGMAVLSALLGVSVRNTMRASGDDFLAFVFVVLRFLFVSVPRSDQAVAARLTEFRGDLAEEFEVVRVASTVAGPARRADGRRMPVGPYANGPAGSVDLLVLFVRLFFVVDVGSRAEDRLHEVDAQRRTGSGARKELATGLLRDQAADVREDDDH